MWDLPRHQLRTETQRFDPRIKVVALIADAFNSPAAMRAMMGAERYRERLLSFAEARRALWAGGEPEHVPAVAPEGRAGMPGAEPFDYYGTDRSPTDGWENRVTALSTTELITLDAMSAAEFISPTPVLFVHGKTDGYCSPESAQKAFDKAAEPKELVWLDTTNHIDLYDVEDYVGPAAARAQAWCAKHLGA